MGIREELALGNIPGKEMQETVIYDTVLDEIIPEDNSFLLKSKERLSRMLKSERARNWRHKLKDIKNQQYMRGFNH